MDKDVARAVIRQVFSSGGELEALIPVLKSRCSEKDYDEYVKQVASAIASIHEALLDKVLARFPELETEMEDNLRRTGKVMP